MAQVVLRLCHVLLAHLVLEASHHAMSKPNQPWRESGREKLKTTVHNPGLAPKASIRRSAMYMTHLDSESSLYKMKLNLVE